MSQSILDHASKIGKDFIVPIAHDFDSLLFDDSCPPGILFYLLSVLSAIEFKGESGIMTIKIEYASTNRVLATEFVPQ